MTMVIAWPWHQECGCYEGFMRDVGERAWAWKWMAVKGQYLDTKITYHSLTYFIFHSVSWENVENFVAKRLKIIFSGKGKVISRQICCSIFGSVEVVQEYSTHFELFILREIQTSKRTSFSSAGIAVDFPSRYCLLSLSLLLWMLSASSREFISLVEMGCNIVKQTSFICVHSKNLHRCTSVYSLLSPHWPGPLRLS